MVLACIWILLDTHRGRDLNQDAFNVRALMQQHTRMPDSFQARASSLPVPPAVVLRALQQQQRSTSRGLSPIVCKHNHPSCKDLKLHLCLPAK